MASDTNNGTEVLVLSDNTGNSYAIPRETLERYRLTEEQKAQIQDQAGGDDVAGFAMLSAASSAGASAYASANVAANNDANDHNYEASSSSVTGFFAFMPAVPSSNTDIARA